jgi:hypothetical protein
MTIEQFRGALRAQPFWPFAMHPDLAIATPTGLEACSYASRLPLW